MKNLNRKGMTLVEVLFALAMLGVAAVGMYQLSLTLFSSVQDSRRQRTRGVVINNILEATRSNPTIYQVDFNTAPGEVDRILAQDKLPWAIQNDEIYPTETCPKCPQHFGFILQPLVSNLNTRGVYYVIVRVSESNKPGDYYDLVYLVGAK